MMICFWYKSEFVYIKDKIKALRQKMLLKFYKSGKTDFAVLSDIKKVMNYVTYV